MKTLRPLLVLALLAATACATSGDRSPSRLSDIESNDRTWRFGRPGDFRYDDWKIDEEQDREEWRRLREKWKDPDRNGAILDEELPPEEELPPDEELPPEEELPHEELDPGGEHP